MIIPLSRKKINIGDLVVVIKEIVGTYYLISVGHELVVVDFDKEYSKWICLDMGIIGLHRVWFIFSSFCFLYCFNDINLVS